MNHREERKSYWRALIEKQGESGLSGGAFCRRQKINPHRFYFWHRLFRGHSAGTGFVHLVPASNTLCSAVRSISAFHANHRVPKICSTTEPDLLRHHVFHFL